MLKRIQDIRVKRPRGIGRDIRRVFLVTNYFHKKLASKYQWYDRWHQKPYASKVHVRVAYLVAFAAFFLVAAQFFGIDNEPTVASISAPSTTLVAKDTSGDYKTKTGETEVVSKRTESFKTFKKEENGQDVFRVAGQVGAIHYKTDPFSTTEQYKEIDLTLRTNKNKKNSYDYYLNQNGYQINIWNQQKVQDSEINYAAKFIRAGQSISMAPVSLAWENSAGEYQEISKPVGGITPEIDNNNYTITWKNAFGNGLDFRYNISPDKFFKTVIINDKSDLPAATIGSDGLKLTIVMSTAWSDVEAENDFAKDNKNKNLAAEYKPAEKKDESKNNPAEFSFEDGQSRDLWFVQKPLAWDSSTNRNTFDMDYKLEKVSDDNFMKLSVKNDDIQNQSTVYPLLADAAITEQKVSASSDDADQYGLNSNWFLNTTANVLNSGYVEYSGFRWSAIPIPNSATINSASFSPYLYYSGQTSPNVTIYGNAEASAATFSSSGDTPNSRTRTSASVLWNASSLPVGYNASADISSVVQEIVNLGGWAVNNPLALLTVGTSGTTACNLYFYDQGTAYASKFNATYTAAPSVISISGTSNESSGTVAVAVNGTLQAQTGTISSNAWSISDVSVAYGDVVTTFISDATNANASTAATKYDSVGDITDMVLDANVLSIGSADNQSLSVTELSQYTHTQNTHVMHGVSSSVLTVDAGSVYTSETINVLSGSTLTVSGTETVNTFNIDVAGTLVSGGNSTYNITGSWDATGGAFTASTSTVNFTAASTGKTLAGTMTDSSSFYNLKFNNASGGWTANADITVSGVLTITAGTFNASSRTITLTGPTTPFVKTGTFTESTSTFNYANTTGNVNITAANYYNLGIGTVADTASAKTYTLAGTTNVSHQITVGNASSTNSDVFSLSARTLTLTGSGTDIWNVTSRGSISIGTSTINYTGSSATTVRGMTYYNLGVGTTSDTAAGVTYTLGGDSTVSNLVTVGNASSTNKDILALSSYTMIVTRATSAPFTITTKGTFQADTSTVKYESNNAMSVVALTYYNLILDPTISAARAYTAAGAITVGGSLTINPTASSSYALTFTLAGILNVTGATTITKTSSATAVLTTAASNYAFTTGSLDIQAGGTLTSNGSAVDVNGNLSNAGTLTATTATMTVAGNYTNSGVFTDSSGRVTFDGTALQTITAGGTTANFDFYNLTITNASAAGISFADSVTVNATFTDTTPSSLLTFLSGSTYAFNAISINGGATGTRIVLTSSTSGTPWNLNITAASPVASYVNVKDSNANVEINATTGGYDSTGNTNWLFPGADNPPTNDSLTFTNPYSTNVAVADNTAGWNFRALVSDVDGPTDLDYVELRLANSADSTQPYDSLKFRWTQATDTFSEVADTQSAATIVSTSADSSVSGNQWTLNFKIKINNSFLAKDTNYAAELDSIDDAAASANDNYVNKFQVTPLSLTLDVDSDTIAFGNLLPGSVIVGTTTTSVTTNYPNGYSLAVSDGVADSDSCLLHSDLATRIADYAGTILSPTSWSGNGLGISLYIASDKNTTQWGTGTTASDSNNKYAGVPTNATTIHSKTGAPTSSDQSSVGYKLVVPYTQKTGGYSGNIVYTATGVLN